MTEQPYTDKDADAIEQIVHLSRIRNPVSYTHLTLPTTPYV